MRRPNCLRSSIASFLSLWIFTFIFAVHLLTTPQASAASEIPQSLPVTTATSEKPKVKSQSSTPISTSNPTSELPTERINPDGLKAPWLKVFPVGADQSKPALKKGIFNFLLKETPTAMPSSTNPPDCDSYRLSQVMDTSTGFNNATRNLAGFFGRCENILRRWGSSQYGALLHEPFENDGILHRPHMYEIVLTLPYKSEIHGLVAMKDMKRPRPLVIAICGTGCNLSSAAARMFVTHLYDESPFNLLVLPSITGFDFIRENHGIGIGGFEEGRQTFEIVRLLESADSPIRDLISSVHIVGASLGGNGALFSGLYASYNNKALEGADIKSIFAYNGVVDLEASLASLDRGGLIGKAFYNEIIETVVANLSYLLNPPSDYPEIYKPGNHSSLPFVQTWVYPRYALLAKEEHFLLPPFTQSDIDTPDKFWHVNNFLNYYSQTRIPTFVLGTEDDPIVDPKANYAALAGVLTSEDKKYVNVLDLPHGSHCGADFVYGHDIITAAIQGFILAHSPEFDFNSRHHELSMPELKNVNLYSGEKYFGYEWAVSPKKSAASLTLKIWTPYKHLGSDPNFCRTRDPYYSFMGCFRTVEFKVPLNTIFENDIPAISPEHAQALTRFLNFRVHVLTDKGDEPVDTLEKPSQIAWVAD